MNSANAVPVLMYHHVSPHPGLVTVSPRTFEAQMAHLARAGYTALGADEFLDFLRGKRAVPRRSVLITFDDGYLDNYVYAYPVLARYGLRAVIFAVTGWIGDGPVRAHAGDGKAASLPATPDHRACKAAIAAGRAGEVMLRWSEIEAMEKTGAMEMHSHTHRHIRWDKHIPDAGRRLAELEADLAASRAALHQRLHKQSRHLCWPWGYYETGYQTVAEKCGFEALYTTHKGVNTAATPAQCVNRAVVKDKAGAWFATRLWIYGRPAAGALYTRLRGA